MVAQRHILRSLRLWVDSGLSGASPDLLQYLQLRIPEPASLLPWRSWQQHEQQRLQNRKQLPQPGNRQYGDNNDQFFNNYFEVPNYANAITDNPGQSTTNFIPAPGIGRNSFGGPDYRMSI